MGSIAEQLDEIEALESFFTDELDSVQKEQQPFSLKLFLPVEMGQLELEPVLRRPQTALPAPPAPPAPASPNHASAPAPTASARLRGTVRGSAGASGGRGGERGARGR